MLVAATTRMSTFIGFDSPTRSTSRSCSARSSLAWSGSDIDDTSSMNSVPWCASSKRPTRVAMAPVNAPFTWPKSSASASAFGNGRGVEGHEPLVGARASGGGWCGRSAPCRCRSRPGSARCCSSAPPAPASRRACCIVLSRPMMLSKRKRSRSCARSSAFSSRSRRWSSAVCSTRGELRQLERLDQEVDGAALHRLDRFRHAAEAGDRPPPGSAG